MKPSASNQTAAERRAEYDAWYEEQVRLGLEDIEAGRILRHEEVMIRMARLRAELEAEDAGQRAA